MVFDESTGSTEMMPKIISLIVAIVVFACVLVPICSSLANSGQNDSDSGSGGDGTALSNEQYVLSKMAYGEHPTFDINVDLTGMVALDEITYEGQTIPLTAPSMAIIYADAQTTVYLNAGIGYGGQIEPMILHIDDTTFDDPYLEVISVNGLSRVVSDGNEVTAYYTNGEYTFDIASQCYYSNPNGAYGCYVNPELFALLAQGMEQDGIDYIPTYPTSLYITDGYTPYFVHPVGGELREAYRDCGQSNITESFVKSCTPYYTVADGQITDVGWDYEIDVPYGGESNITTGTAIGQFMILPNTIGGESGEGSGGSTDMGMAGTLISIIPVFVALALILYIVGMFYTNKVE